jgi:hypothetical protein
MGDRMAGPEIAEIDSTFDLSEFAPESLRAPPADTAVTSLGGSSSALGRLGLLDTLAVPDVEAAGSRDATRSRPGNRLPPTLTSLWDRPERAVAAAGALVILLALAIVVVAVGRGEGDHVSTASSRPASAGAGVAPSGESTSRRVAAPAPRAAARAGVAPSGESASRRAAAPAPRAAASGTGVPGSRTAPEKEREVRAQSPAVRRRAPTSQAPAARETSVGTTGAETQGWVALRAPFRVEMWRDGRLLGRSGSRVKVPAGQYVVELVNERLNYRELRTVAITAGATSQLRVEAPRGAISLNAVPWAAVWIDGRPVGETPLGEVPIAVGEHVVRFEHPQLGQRQETVLVRAGEVARVSVNLRR